MSEETTPKGPDCDTPGCGARSTYRTTGHEVDAQGRGAIAKLNVCEHHRNWPHSEDAAAKVASNPNGYNARK